MTTDQGKERNNIFSPYYFLVFPRDRGLNLDSLPSLFLPPFSRKNMEFEPETDHSSLGLAATLLLWMGTVKTLSKLEKIMMPQTFPFSLLAATAFCSP